HARGLRMGRVAVLGMRDLLHRAADQLLLAVAQDLAQAAVHLHEAAAEIDVGDAGGRELESLPVERLARAQRDLRMALLGDVADGGDDAVPVGVARATPTGTPPSPPSAT